MFRHDDTWIDVFLLIMQACLIVFALLVLAVMEPVAMAWRACKRKRSGERKIRVLQFDHGDGFVITKSLDQPVFLAMSRKA